MSNEATNEKATTETAPPSCAPSNGSESSQQTTDRLFREAMRAVDALSDHLEGIGDTDQMYKVNKAYKILWSAQ